MIRYFTQILTALILAFAFLPTQQANAQPGNRMRNGNCLNQETILNLPSAPLSQEELNGLVYMREEEKLARDVYQVLYDVWGLRVFNNIARSEQMHTTAIKTLLQKYQLTDPVEVDSLGKFKNVTLQKLFNELTTRGKQSLTEALKVGALIEEIDILDLQKELKNIEGNKDIQLVYENLMRGSRNHLRAFVRNLQQQGVSYSPVKLSPASFEAIISAPMERGRN